MYLCLHSWGRVWLERHSDDGGAGKAEGVHCEEGVSKIRWKWGTGREEQIVWWRGDNDEDV